MGQPGSVRNKLLRDLDVAAHVNDVAFFAGTEHHASIPEIEAASAASTLTSLMLLGLTSQALQPADAFIFVIPSYVSGNSCH
jgi:hypothetical protein